jgi:type VI secretion system protein ImpL
MKLKERFLKIIKARAFWWFWVAVLLSLLIWFVGPGISFYNVAPIENTWLQVLLIALTFLVWFGIHFKTRIQQHLQGTKIFRDEDEVKPKLGGHVSRRESRLLKKDVRKLKYFIRGRSTHRYWFFKRNNLYDTPWYLVLGPQGAGKTSLIRQAHLQFIAQSYSHFDLESEAFHYALAEEALLLDVDAKLFVQKTLKERHLWLTLIKCIKRARPRRPLNGVLLALSITDLLTAERELQQQLFENFRLRLHELQQRLGMQIPVYVVLTHIDALSGFNDFVLRFTEPEREEVLGITFATKSSSSALDQFPFEYDVLLKHIHQRLARDLDGEYLPETRSRMWYFSMQMAALKEKILAFGKEIFLTRRMLQDNDWRGLYFVAHNLQNENRVDVVTGERALSMLEVPRFLKDKSFFAAQILKQALLPEQEYVGMHPLFRQHWGLLGQGRTLIAAGLAMGLIILWLISINQYLNYNEQVLFSLNHPETPSNVSLDKNLNAFYPRLNLLGNLYHQADNAPLLHLGLWVHESAHTAVGALYQQALAQNFLPYISATLAQGLTAAVLASNHGESMNNVQNLYFYLSSYLMLNELDKLDSEQINNVLAAYWNNVFANNVALQAWLRLRLNDALTMPLTPQTLNISLVKQARGIVEQPGLYAGLFAPEIKRAAE